MSRLDAAVALGDVAAVTSGVKAALEETAASGRLQLPARFTAPRTDCYARRLLHRDLARGYTAVVMTWGPGQGTPLHDHAGMWCVEGVLKGRIEVARYDLLEEQGGTFAFVRLGRVEAGPGMAGCLIPPFEYHVLRNARPDAPSVTLHVYGGEMDSCCIYQPRPDGRYDRLTRPLSYHD